MSDAGVTLLLGDCLEVMRDIPDGSVGLIAADLPYGTTRSAWDVVIPFEPLWSHYRRVLKPRGAVVLTASQPFAAQAVVSNPRWFKWEDIWRKSNPAGHLNAKVMPLRQHENILVFGPHGVTYNPQMFTKPSVRAAQRSVKTKGSYGDFNEGVFRSVPDDLGYPRSVVDFSTAYHAREAGLHPNQKPTALFEYLIRTYSDPGDVVLDNAMGSGTTGVACINTDRRFIGIEKDEAIFATASRRIAAHLASTPLLTPAPA